jgi:acyl carrier protein
MSTSAISEQRMSRLRELAIEHLEVEPEGLTPTSDFIADLGADSLGFILICWPPWSVSTR